MGTKVIKASVDMGVLAFADIKMKELSETMKRRRRSSTRGGTGAQQGCADEVKAAFLTRRVTQVFKN